jgi:predicted AlkP superfamily phosphohydrolase/phosphomutase
MQKVFIIGWDGATFDLIRPWVAAGKLPTIARILESGAHGPLRSSMPPWTFPAWSSFMTGMNPGKHGIFDFTRRQPGKYEVEFVNGGQRRAPSFWNILSRAGRKVVSISVPCTYPPEPVNGVMISGFDAPGLGGKSARADSRGMYPPELCDELNRKIGGHPMGAFIINEVNRGTPEIGLDRMIKVVERKAATAKYLMETREWDCFMILFGESDGVGHHFWKYCDPKSPLFQEHPAELRNSILRVYQALDRETGELLSRLPADTTLLMMSDHGFGGTGDWIVHPNCWLHKRGTLQFRGRAAHWRSRVLDGIKLRAVALLPAILKRLIYRIGRRGLGSLESRVRYGMIDWENTQAYFEENPYYPTLWINLKGRQPKGIVEPGRQYEELRDRLIGELTDWRHPESGEPIVERAFRREEVYSGPCVEQAPDIVVKWALHQGYSYAFKLSSKSPDLQWIRRVNPNQPENLQFYSGKSGTHRDDGIFLAVGPQIRAACSVTGARIIDLAPTILHMLDVPVPDDMDGRVLQEIFLEESQRELASQAAVPRSDAAAIDNQMGYSTEEEQVISDRLRALGYVE